MNKTKKIFSKQLAGELARQGFKIVDISPNKYKPQYFYYEFEYSEELQKALDKHFQK